MAIRFTLPGVAAVAVALLTPWHTTFALAQTETLPAVSAEVRNVNLERQRITLRHGPIPNVDMGAMTMAFRVKDPALLQAAKAGDQLSVTFDKVDGNLTVMSIDVVKAP